MSNDICVEINPKTNSSKNNNTNKQSKSKKNNIEAQRVQKILSEFYVNDLRKIEGELIYLFSTGISQKELLCIANIACEIIPGCPKPSREATRDFLVLKKWCFDNWNLIGDFMRTCVVLKDKDGNVINFENQKSKSQTAKSAKSEPKKHNDVPPINSVDLTDVNKRLIELFGKDITHKELIKIAEKAIQTIPNCQEIKREAYRDERILKKWFDDNWNMILDFLKNCRVQKDDYGIIEISQNNECEQNSCTFENKPDNKVNPKFKFENTVIANIHMNTVKHQSIDEPLNFQMFGDSTF